MRPPRETATSSRNQAIVEYHVPVPTHDGTVGVAKVLRLATSRSNSPHFERNLSDDGVTAEATEDEFVVGTERIYSDAHPFSIVFSVVRG